MGTTNHEQCKVMPCYATCTWLQVVCGISWTTHHPSSLSSHVRIMFFVVLTLTRIITSAGTGQAPVTVKGYPTHFFIFLHIFFTHFYFPVSGQAVVSGVVLSSPRFLPSISIAHRVQRSHCSSIFHRGLLTLSRFPHVNLCGEMSPRIHTSMHSGGFELAKLTYTRPEDNLIRHRGDRYYLVQSVFQCFHVTFFPYTINCLLFFLFPSP